MLDIIVLIVVLVSAFIGMKKGLVCILTKLVGFILAIILAYTCYETLGNYLCNNYKVNEKINTSIKNVISEEAGKEEEDVYKLNEVLGKFGLQDKINLDEELENVESGSNLTDVVSEKITQYIINILSFLAIFLSVIILSSILSFILSAVFSLPGLKFINKTGGFIIELVLSLFKLWIVLRIIEMLSPMGFMQGVNNLIDTSIFVKFMYHNNLLMGLLSKIRI
ncbi:MAG: CvpA family protein [Clostridia bacterium]|nr:CvpA family protein [Clostridia bacterium]